MLLKAKLFICLNKTDKEETTATLDLFQESEYDIYQISAKIKKGIEFSIRGSKRGYCMDNTFSSQTIVTNARHADALRRTSEALDESINAVKMNIPGDLLAQDLKLALDGLGEITGTISTEELLSNIFSKFCIGK